MGDKKHAGRDLTEGIKVESGRDSNMSGAIVGNQSQPQRRSTRQTIAIGVLIICVASAVAGLGITAAIIFKQVDSDTGTKLVVGLIGTAAISGIVRALLGKGDEIPRK